MSLWFLLLPLWYQATSELDIFHPVLKFGVPTLHTSFVPDSSSVGACFPCSLVHVHASFVPDSSCVGACFPCTDFVFVRRGCGCTVLVSLSCVRDFSFISGHVYRSVFNLIVRERNVLVALFHFTSPCVPHGWYVVAP